MANPTDPLQDPYAALGLTRAATDKEIKAAFRKMARKHHPDLHPDDAGAEATFKAASAAYDLLGDPEKRRRFDAGDIDASGAERPERRFYRDYAAEQPRDPRYGNRFGEDFDGGDIFAEILRQQRGRGGAGGRFAFRGADLHFALEVPFLEAVHGARTRITLPDGAAMEVALPPGAADGQTIRLRGKGAPGEGGGPDGDALVTLTVRPHPHFRREGDDIHLTLPITIDEAVLGGKVAVPTIDGPVQLTIPKGASSGRVLRLRGRGVDAGRGPRGDQLVDLRIVAPPDPDPALEAFLESWRNGHRHDPRKGMLP